MPRFVLIGWATPRPRCLAVISTSWCRRLKKSAALRGSGWLLSRLSRLGELGGLGQKSHPAEADQFVRQSCQPPRIAIGETVFNDDIAASYPAKLTQSAWNA